MPTYVYRRPDGTTFEQFQRITDDPLTEDPETGHPVTRVISGGAGVQFKGTGFYETDYVRKPKAEGASAKGGEGSASSDSASESTSGSTSKTSTKTGSKTTPADD